ncbi:hypothetical protein UCRPC4_g01336 [Phaeomoniella chlamydospora]|uniref:Uncharacterized protein n=1 Tax=Phaeomoniella chlamydospora TaxID=158046 RepID=A0A0G2EXT5_PHACM|nr:hypothetical protein UCRPC4_g01336 [Phaeomoniella chlamydospora]
MAFINTTSVAGLILALYLSTFVLFAVVRIATGVSIQRIGYLSLRRIAFTPREGIRVELRSLGLNIHRPTFAQPTWLSLRFGELHVTVDPSLIQQSQTKRTKRNPEGAVAEHLGPDRATRGAEQRAPSASRRSKLWKRLTETKERIKRLHRQIKWIRLIDLIAFNTTLDIVNVGRLQMGVFSLALDTRQKMVDRGKLWRHKKEASKGERPAEWIVVIKSILLSLPQNDSVEVLDSLTFNIHGFLSKQKEGLRDTSIAIRLGKLHVPLSEIMELRTRLASNFPSEEPKSAITFKHQEEFSFNELAEELDKPGSREDTIVQTVADSKEFVSSILRGVQEIQMALSWVRVSHRIQPSPTTPTPLLLNVVLHELGVDLHRLDPRTPAHRMYFSKDDVAHQALVAVISISVSLGENEADSSKILYVPMTTTTVKTTLPAKTVSFSEHRDVTERNANVFFSNLVITSPSVDLEPRHLPVLHAILTGRPTTSKRATSSNHRLVSRLLPKISLKLSIQEPVIRCVLPHPVQNSKSADDYDLLISSISSISLDVESSHSSTNEQEYSLSSNFRLVDHKFYYQSSAGNKHDMVYMESVEVKTQVNAANDVSVAISGTLRTFTIRMVREEVGQGVYRIVKQFNKSVQSDKLRSRLDKAPRRSFLRRIPKWLTIIQLEGSNFSVEIAGTDAQISKNTRGLALQLESWTAEYLSHRFELGRRGSSSRRRTISSSTVVDSPKSPPRHHHSRRYGNDQTDGRRLAIHVRNLEGFIIEDDTLWESDPFLSLPRSEVALSTSSDLQGSIFHVNSHIKALLVHFSLYRYYAVGVAGTILREAFFGPPAKIPYSDANKSHDSNPDFPQGLETGHPNHYSNTHSADLVTVDVKAALIQVKTQMPHDPPMLLQIYELAAGRHRWSSPFLRAHLIRLHAEAPFLKHVWARVASVNNIRLDLRRSRKPGKPNAGEEQSIDLATDFIRLAIPHGLTTYKIFDNFINVAKTISQLNHRFKTRTNDYILEKHPEEPKRVPRISVRSKALLFELEDDPFEWKLGLIYRVGKVEQVQRIAREEAFKAKAKKVDTEINRRASSGRRDVSQSRHRHSSQTSVDHARSRSYDFSTSRRSRSRGRQGLRYDPDGVCDMSSTSKVNTSDAWQKLQEHNARSWKRRIDSVMQLSDTKIRRVRRLFAGADEPPESAEDHEAVLSIPSRPGILGAIISDLHLMIDKPSFPLAECNSFLHRIGKGIPLDMQYSMLVPMHLKLDMGEARVVLRDYPLNLLHVPAIRPGQPPKLPSWSLETDFVIAEEFRDYRSTRHVKVDIIPPSHDEDGGLVPGFALDVRRTVSPVKTYSDVTVDVNTSLATTISWGTAYQPVIQDMMMIIEGFTKPEIDPSDRVGFWDKIRLNFHSRISVHWKGDGDVQLRLKGSRDPYVVTGYGAGFVMCWRNDVQWRINTDDDPRRFMTVTSGEYVLAIPDYSRHARSMQGLELENDTESASTGSSQKNAAIFKKVVMKLSGNVQWTAGLVFERDPAEGKRSFDFKPHHEVVLRNPKHLSEEELKDYDAFKGFRSDHIHLSVGVSAPFDREWTSSNTTPSKSYNTVHLTPKFFTHFYDWWSLFSGVMSLPIRQGKLWRGLEKKSKKFGRHLATIKYRLLLSPLFMAHIYKHKEVEEYNEETVSATGLKLRLDSFMLDLHQRREAFDTLSKTKSKQARTSGMRINQAQVDFISADVRAVSANIGGTTTDDLMKGGDEILPGLEQPVPAVDLSRFHIPDQDFSWIDMDDFVELDWVLPSESNPETSILPLAYSPRFTYIRQTDHNNIINGDESRTSPFGDEPTHYCVMTQDNDPRRVQMALVEQRLREIEAQIEAHTRLTGEQELRFVRDGNMDKSLREQFDLLIEQGHELESKKAFLQGGLRHLARLLEHPKASPQSEEDLYGSGSSSAATSDSGTQGHPEMDGLYTSPNDDLASDFNNKFIVHNVQLKWNNPLRNVILRYMHQMSQRRGFVYYMSRRAVKFILDIVEEQNKNKYQQRPESYAGRTQSHEGPDDIGSPTEEKDEDVVVKDRIEQLLNDAKQFVDADASEDNNQEKGTSTAEHGDQIAEDFTAQNTYHVRLVAPQIQLQSEKNTKSVALVAAKGMQLKVISIMDRARLSDEVSGLVQQRFALEMDGAQFFVTTQKRLYKYLHLYSGNKYGNVPGSAWPPWVSLEVMFDFTLNPFGFQRIIQKTSASLHYEKYNNLRLKYNEHVAAGDDGQIDPTASPESRVDHFWVDFPRVRAICDSAQYYAMYIIVMDLLLYSEPLEKIRSERLEKIMLASDFSDLRGAPEIATRLQDRIRQLEEIKNHFQINAKYLDRQGWQDRIGVERDLVGYEDELFFIMKAITTSQRKAEERKTTQSTGLLRWYLSASEIVWHLMRDKNEPLVEIQLRNAAYERIDNSDGSNHNAMVIERIHGLNLLPNALYPEIIGPFHDPNRKITDDNEDETMFKVHWYMLEAIAGIPVLENFEVNLYPLKVQLERELGSKLFEYIFPQVGANGSDNGGFSPLMIKHMQPLDEDEDSEAEQASEAFTPDPNSISQSRESYESATRPGAMELRLKPTMNLSYDKRPASSSASLKSKGLGFGDNLSSRFLSQSNRSPGGSRAQSTRPPTLRKGSADSVSVTIQPPSRSSTALSSSPADDKPKKFTLTRSSSKDSSAKDKDKPSDDISQMMSRASNYMTLAHVKINSVSTGFLPNALGRRFTHDSQRARAHDASLDDSEESTKRKTVLLLGKKILGSLS